jgi:hypothetical protein
VEPLLNTPGPAKVELTAVSWQAGMRMVLQDIYLRLPAVV